MAKGKPAITGMHSQGIIDDIFRPIVAKAARKIADRGVGKVAGKMDKIADKSIAKRAGSYAKKGKTSKYNLMDNEVRVSGPKKSPAKNYKKSSNSKNQYEKDMWKARAKVVNYNNIQKVKKK
jgi:hypothetical protein